MVKSIPKLYSFFTSHLIPGFWLCFTPYVRNHCPFCKNQVSAEYIRVDTSAPKPSLPVSPDPALNFKSSMKLTSFISGSWDILHPKDSPGKNPQRFSGANFEDPS